MEGMKPVSKQRAAFSKKVKKPKLEGVSEAFAVTAEEALLGFYRKSAKRRSKKAKQKVRAWSPVLPGSFESNSR